jgi:hypothetical protein
MPAKVASPPPPPPSSSPEPPSSSAALALSLALSSRQWCAAQPETQ